MTLVVDASVACKWFIEEQGSDEAVSLLQRGESLLAPDLMVPEVCNVAWQKTRSGEITALQAEGLVEGLVRCFDDLVPDAPLARRALAIAVSLDHPVYDCFYLALAEARETRVVTADARLLARLVGTPWASHAVSLDDVGRLP